MTPKDMTLEQLKDRMETCLSFTGQVNGQAFMELLDAYIDRRMGAGIFQRPHKKTPELLEKAQKLRAGGASYEAIGFHIGVSDKTVRAWLDPAYAQRRRTQVANSKTARKAASHSLYEGES